MRVITGSTWAYQYGANQFTAIVLRLPRGAGLSEWSMGAGMYASVGSTIYETEGCAMYAAEQEAESACVAEAEYQEEWQEAQRAAEQVADLWREAREHIASIRYCRAPIATMRHARIAAVIQTHWATCARHAAGRTP
ncbi:hypothetical protein P7F88_25295 [Vibrio hannami]|uniref:hypothetical protein n=1 Tax=Vibrio hannami TaxID=2717094 RepID=UPI00240FF99D|nr:hypothetical protein [Vibrio hannami]MDG3089181.1 hypothetical protein [Vibrio hannami]